MFATLANKRKIEEVTSAKDDVAPVYLLEDIWQTMQNSGPDTAAGFVEYVNKRLTHKLPVVKQKSLRLVKYLCGKGSSDFKRGFSKHAGSVRELVHYRGEPDPFKGDVPNQKVRDMAKEALDAIFAPTETPSYAPANSSLQGRIRGFGSTAASDGFSAAPNSSKPPSSGMMGFGNPRFEPPSASGQSGGGFSGAGNSRFGRGGSYEAPGETSGRGGESFGGMIQRVGSGALSPKAIMNSITSKGNELLQGRRGPGILNNDDHTGYSSDEADRGYDRPQANGPTIAPSSLGPRRSENGGSSGGDGEEARLVNQVCTPGGMRAHPSREDLRMFVESVGSLKGVVVAERLEEKMADPSWQAVLRALCALEAVIQQGSTAACGEIAVFFQTEPGALEAALDSPQASVRQRAVRILHLLGVSGGSPSSAPGAAAARNGPSASAPDLLGGLEDEAPASQQPTASKSGGDLLGDLMDPAPGTAAADGMFSGLAVPAPAVPATPQPPATVDLFGGLDHPTSAPVPPVEDLFGGLSVGTAQPAAASPGFSQMQDLMGGSSSAVKPPLDTDFFGDPSKPAPSAPSGGNALADMFGDLSTGSGSSPPARQPTPEQIAAQRTSSGERGDPLASLALPQTQQAPMGQGLSAQRGAFPQLTMPAGFQGMGSQQPGFMMPGGFPAQQLTPQQIQYIRQIQYMQYMQQMQAMQARGMAMPQMAGMPQQQQQQQQPPFASFQASSFQQNNTSRPSSGSGGGLGGPMSLDALTGAGSGHTPSLASSSALGISQQSDFDFVGDHVKTLRSKK